MQPVSEGLRQVPAPAAKRLGAPGLAVKVQSKVSSPRSRLFAKDVSKGVEQAPR